MSFISIGKPLQVIECPAFHFFGNKHSTCLNSLPVLRVIFQPRAFPCLNSVPVQTESQISVTINFQLAGHYFAFTVGLRLDRYSFAKRTIIAVTVVFSSKARYWSSFQSDGGKFMETFINLPSCFTVYTYILVTGCVSSGAPIVLLARALPTGSREPSG